MATNTNNPQSKSVVVFPFLFAILATDGFHSVLTGASAIQTTMHEIKLNIFFSFIGFVLSTGLICNKKNTIFIKAICSVISVYTVFVTGLGLYLVFSDFMYDATQCAKYFESCNVEQFRQYQ
ncbi:hypothetical protein N5N20_004101 [Vibrio parahaemolyticus]|nr:hypothetical protein [Vibrio parahaemolyticus]